MGVWYRGLYRPEDENEKWIFDARLTKDGSRLVFESSGRYYVYNLGFKIKKRGSCLFRVDMDDDNADTIKQISESEYNKIATEQKITLIFDVFGFKDYVDMCVHNIITEKFDDLRNLLENKYITDVFDSVKSYITKSFKNVVLEYVKENLKSLTPFYIPHYTPRSVPVAFYFDKFCCGGCRDSKNCINYVADEIVNSSLFKDELLKATFFFFTFYIEQPDDDEEQEMLNQLFQLMKQVIE